MSTSTVAERARIEWSMRLTSAARGALACAVVGGATLYGPKFLAHHIKFSAFSYFTTVLIVSGTRTVGDTLRGCWHALCATAMVVPLAMLWRWMIGLTDELQPGMAAAGVAAAGFLVALPEFTHLTAKKMAFGQIIIVCTVVVGPSDRFMQPLYIAASTALGALASLLAFVVPYPALATYKVRELCRVYAENASQRVDIYLRALIAADEFTKMELISQAKPLSETGSKLLQSITNLQEGMKWETPWRRVNSVHRLERIELQMRGIEYSLLYSPAFPTQTSQQNQISHLLETTSAKLKEKIQQVSCFSPSNSVSQSESMQNPSLPLDSTLPITRKGCILNYFSCIDMILNDTSTAPNELQPDPKTTMIHERLEFSIKCSLSLGLAVLLGQLFDPDHGCYAGLAVAISFVNGRQAIFTMANARAQGTSIGSVYGAMCCFLLRHEMARLAAILPWIAITSLIRHSKMYGQTGEISAAVGALLILGRKNYGAPQEFAMARLMEVFIGLSALIFVELLLQPFRAATLAKNHLCMTLNALRNCTNEMQMQSIETMRNKHTHLSSLVSKLRDLVGDAELEPDFWFSPFRTSCYRSMLKSLSKVSDLLHFITHSFEVISELSESVVLSEGFKERMNSELGMIQETLKQAVSTETKEVARQQVDLEAGALRDKETPVMEQREAEWMSEDAGENKVREMIMRQMFAIGFCVSSLLKELKDIQICLREINQWENQKSL